MQSFVIDPFTPATMYAGTDDGLFKSTDAGNSWAPVSAGLTNTNVLSLAVDPSSAATVYAGTQAGLFKSTDGGMNWTLSSTGITNPIIHAIVIDPTNPSTVYLGKASGGLVFKSVNGGQTWSNVSGGLPTFPTFLSALAIDPRTPATIYAGTDSSGAFRSIIGGGDWKPTGAVGLATSTVESLLDEAILTTDQATGLMDKLDAAVRSMDRGNLNAACGALGAFINQVNAFVKTGVLSPAESQTLIDAVNVMRSQNHC